MDVESVVAAAVGAVGGYGATVVADRVGVALYGPGTDGYDSEDAALAPLLAPSTTRVRLAVAAIGAVGLGAMAAAVPGRLAAVTFGVLLVGYLAAMVIDLQFLRLPNRFTYPAALLAGAGTALLSSRLDVAFAGAWIGAATYAGLLLVTRVAYQMLRGVEGMGLGDVKLAVSLGASAGWLGGYWSERPADGIATPVAIGAIQLVVFAALLGNLLGAVGGIALVRKVRTGFPFGPALVAGWVVVVAASERLVS